MIAHPLALQLRNVQTPIELSIDTNTTGIFQSPLMSTTRQLESILAREAAYAAAVRPTGTVPRSSSISETKDIS